MRTISIVCAALCLAACDRGAGDAEAFAQDAAQDVIEPKLVEITERIDELEAKLERKKRVMDTQGDYIKAVDAALDEERQNRKREVTALMDHYNDHLVRYHGAAR